MIDKEQLMDILMHIYHETHKSPGDSLRDIINESLEKNNIPMHLNDDETFDL